MWPYWVGFGGIHYHVGPQLAICGLIGYRDLISVFSRETKKVYHTGPNWVICGHIGWGSDHKIHCSIGGHMGFKGLWGMYIQKGAHYTQKSIFQKKVF